jgi:hypothetical protein
VGRLDRAGRGVNCTDCRYSQVDTGDDFPDGPLLRCHRYPPQVFTFGDIAGQTWPNVGPDDWCGEWQRPRPAKGEAVPVNIVSVMDPGSGRPTTLPPLGPVPNPRRW